MTRQQLEHIIRASGAITGSTEIVVIGSQAILGTHPEAPAPLSDSIEADVFTLRDPHEATLIDGSIGEGSPFHDTFGYHAHGVGVETAVLPAGWRDRLVRICGPGTSGVLGLCLDPHDLAVAKLVAGREKDQLFVAEMIRLGYTGVAHMRRLLATTPLSDELRTLCGQRLDRIASARA